MTVGDGHSGIGKTLYTWDSDVERVVQRLHSRYSAISVNTYTCHPFCGWERRSLDVWGAAGRGQPLSTTFSKQILAFLFNMPGEPLIRHYILDHVIWTSFGGYGVWPRDDHTGLLRHVHVTYWPVPPVG
jgi:hypothetical protein